MTHLPAPTIGGDGLTDDEAESKSQSSAGASSSSGSADWNDAVGIARQAEEIASHGVSDLDMPMTVDRVPPSLDMSNQ